MRIPRCFTSRALQTGQVVDLEVETAHHLVNVLRLRAGQDIVLFNGVGGEYAGQIETATKKQARVLIGDHTDLDRESPLAVTLAQGISRGQKMDYTIQKAVELGVQRIVPVLNVRSSSRLDADRRQKKHDHWTRIIIAACEQSGRNRLPELLPVMSLEEWLAADKSAVKLVLDPLAGQRPGNLPPPENGLTLLIGSEGGLNDAEINAAVATGYQPVCLGPRVLRTETAAVTVLGICQALWGDL